MPFFILILTAVAGAIWWWVRSNPREALDVADDIVTTAVNAPRRLAFKRGTRAHPVEGIEDPRIAVAAIGQAFLELEDLPVKDARDRLHVLLRSRLRLDEEEATEMEVLGRWLITQCNGPDQAISRLARHLRRLDGDASWEVMTGILADLEQFGSGAAQRAALADLRMLFGK